MTSSPVASRKQSSTSRVDRPLAYISATRRSNTPVLWSKNSISRDRYGPSPSRTWGTWTRTLPSAVRSVASS